MTRELAIINEHGHLPAETDQRRPRTTAWWVIESPVSCVPFAAVPAPPYPHGIAWRAARRLTIEAARIGLWATIGVFLGAYLAAASLTERLRRNEAPQGGRNDHS